MTYEEYVQEQNRRAIWDAELKAQIRRDIQWKLDHPAIPYIETHDPWDDATNRCLTCGFTAEEIHYHKRVCRGAPAQCPPL